MMQDQLVFDGSELGQGNVTVPIGECAIGMPDKPAIIFEKENGQVQVGQLEYGPPMRFEGDAEESARIMFELVCYLWNEPQGQTTERVV